MAVYDLQGDAVAQRGKERFEEKLPPGILASLEQSNDVVTEIEHGEKKEKLYAFFYPIFISKAIPLQPDIRQKAMVGVAEIELSSQRTYQEIINLFLTTTVVALFLMFFSLGLVIVLSRKIIGPIKQLKEGVDAIAKGDLSYQFNIKTGDEVEELALAFSKMANILRQTTASMEEAMGVLEVKVQARTKELQEVAENLENEVQKRTQELQKKLNELERFNKLTIGRELKMIELKKELVALKASIDKK